MKKWFGVLALALLALSLTAVPTPSVATIGVVGTGTDANGVYYESKWIDGNWSEFYSIGGSYWGAWIDEGTAETPGTETGDYYVYANMVSGDVTTYFWQSDMGGVTKEEDWTKNTATGYYEYSLDYNALALTGPTVAYKEEKDILEDPLNGVKDYYYYKEVDFDGDHNGYDDWYYSTWEEYYPGEGYGDKGWELYNYIDNVAQYEDYEYNTWTGYSYTDKEYYVDKDNDDNWYDNYYTQYWTEYDPYDGESSTSQVIYDKDKVAYSAATYYRYYYDSYQSGYYYTFTDAYTDTDGDGDWSDYGGYGLAGAYYTHSEAEYDTYENYVYSYDETYDSINGVYQDNYTESYPGTGYTYTYLDYQWDADKDGSYSDDYYYYADNWTNYYGENEQEFYNYDYLTDRTADGTPDASYYYFYSDANPVSGYLYTETDYYYDTNKDGSFYDYGSGGAYYSYAYEYYDPSDDYYEKEMYVYTPPSADNTVLFSYTGEYSEAEGMYAYSEKWNYIDADFDKDLYDYGNGGAYRYYTYAETDPDNPYLDYYYEEETWDPWSNKYAYSYSDTETGVNGEPYYVYAYSEIGLDTDKNGDYYDNYYAYAESGNDQYDGDGYKYAYNYTYNYDTGEYQYNYAESYGTGSYYNSYQYIKDTDGNGSWNTDLDFYNYAYNYYYNDDGEAYHYYLVQDDRANARGAYWYFYESNTAYDTGSFEKYAESANLAGFSSQWSAYDGYDGDSESESVFAKWGSYREVTGSWSEPGGINHGTYYDKFYDTDANTAWNNTSDYEIYTYNWNDVEEGLTTAGYEVQDNNTANYFYQEKGMSASGGYLEYTTTDGATGNHNDLYFSYAAGASTPYAGGSEWWDYSANKHLMYIYSGAANAWYLLYSEAII